MSCSRENESYLKLMKEHLGEELYHHSLGVAETAAELARRYGVDGCRAYLSGLLHDYGKVYSREELLFKAGLLDLPLDRITMEDKGLLHGPVGAAILRSELGVSDSLLLKAVAYHTTGHEKMAPLEKVLYLADLIEPGRDFHGVGKLRDLARESLEHALLAAADQTIISVIGRGKLLHPRTIRFRNSLLAGFRGNGG